MNKTPKGSPRREFLGNIAAGAAAIGMMSIPSSIKAVPSVFSETAPDDPESVFKNLKGKHRIVFDVVKPNGMMPFAWPRVFLLTNMATGTPEKDNNVVVVLRHDGIPYAFEDSVWSKYNFGEMFEVHDEEKKAVTKNPFWKPAEGTYKVPGIGAVKIGINELQDSGVQFVVCNAAMTVYSAVAAEKMKLKSEDVYNEWKAALLPGITPVPSGVWAVSRAQEYQCGYCYAS